MIAECIPDQDSAEDGGTRSPDAMHGGLWRRGAEQKGLGEQRASPAGCGPRGEQQRRCRYGPQRRQRRGGAARCGAVSVGGYGAGRARVGWRQGPRGAAAGRATGQQRRREQWPQWRGKRRRGLVGLRRRAAEGRAAKGGQCRARAARPTQRSRGAGASEEGAQSGGGPGASSGAEEEEGGDALGGLRESLGGLSLGGAAPRRTPRRTGWAARDWGAGGRLGALGGGPKRAGGCTRAGPRRRRRGAGARGRAGLRTRARRTRTGTSAAS